MLHESVAGAVLTGLWLMLPAYLSNLLPVFVGGGTPIDFGKKWRDGRPILGPGKTWRGLLLAPLVATLLVWGFRWLATSTGWRDVQPWTDWGPAPGWVLVVYALGVGALVGDAVKSFFKRRTGRDRGARWLGPDQLDFVAGALVFGFLASSLLAAFGQPHWFLEHVTWPRALAIVILTPGLHLLVNYIGWKLGTKDVPW